jgi:hypothetical protein
VSAVSEANEDHDPTPRGMSSAPDTTYVKETCCRSFIAPRRDRLRPLQPGQRVAGIDWAKDDHAVAVLDVAGRTVERFRVTHTAADCGSWCAG